MQDLRSALMTGIDIPIPECKLILHQPSIKEISYLGETEYFTGAQTLCLNKSMFIQDKSELEAINNFQIFMMVMTEKETGDKKRHVMAVLKILFPDYKVLLTPQSLLFQKEGEDAIMIDINNFENFQEYLRSVFCVKIGPMDQQAFNPANAEAKRIADKLMQGRARIAEEKGSSMSSILVQYLSILPVAIHVPKSELETYSLFAFYDLIERFALWLNWDLDVRTRLAGGKPDSHPENWMKNLH